MACQVDSVGGEGHPPPTTRLHLDTSIITIIEHVNITVSRLLGSCASSPAQSPCMLGSAESRIKFIIQRPSLAVALSI